MSSRIPNLDQPSDTTDSTEARMRLALGLGTRPANTSQPATASSPSTASHDSGRQRRRFAQDGDVPVVMLHRSRDPDSGGENKLASLAAELREERAARQKADRALDEANALVNALKTKVKHAEMALEEKMLHENEARAQWDSRLAAEVSARREAETKTAEAVLALSLLERKMEAAATVIAVAPPVSAPPPAGLFDAPDLAPQRAPDLASAAADAPAKPVAKRSVGRPSRKSVEEAPKPAFSAEPHGDDAAEQASDDKPIEWWLPSFRATRKMPIRRKRVTG